MVHFWQKAIPHRIQMLLSFLIMNIPTTLLLFILLMRKKLKVWEPTKSKCIQDTCVPYPILLILKTARMNCR